MLVIVHVISAPPTAGEVTGKGAPVYGCVAPVPHRIVATYPAGTGVSPTVTGVESG